MSKAVQYVIHLRGNQYQKG